MSEPIVENYDDAYTLTPVDVRTLDAEQGTIGYHDPSINGDANTEGLAMYDGSAWTSLADGTAIS